MFYYRNCWWAAKIHSDYIFIVFKTKANIFNIICGIMTLYGVHSMQLKDIGCKILIFTLQNVIKGN